MASLTRRPDPAKVRAALSAQWRALIDYTGTLTEEQLAAPSAVEGWTVRVLASHIAGTAAGVAFRGGRPAATIEDDLLTTRVVEAVIHADDLERSTAVPFPHDRQALAICVRVLANTLATRVPGNSVELRVPPFAAVQCVAGSRHTRGTPPNVVELAPKIWLRLATGRLTWQEAEDAGVLQASGTRADLSAHLPLVTQS